MNLDAETRDWMRFAHTLADAAREILKPAIAQQRLVSIKSDGSMVTQADTAIETRMREMIEQHYPSHGVLGEEHGAVNLGASMVWVIDPIDGTAPFVAGIPVFGTLIGLAKEGRPYLGVIDHVATDERWSGVVDAGAERNGAPVHTRACLDLSSAFMTNSNPDFLSDRERKCFARLRGRVRYTQYGGSCYAYAVLASGQTDLGVDAGLDAVDIFAPAAVIEGAGGVVTDWTNAPLTLYGSVSVLAAGDRSLHAQALALLR